MHVTELGSCDFHCCSLACLDTARLTGPMRLMLLCRARLDVIAARQAQLQALLEQRRGGGAASSSTNGSSRPAAVLAGWNSHHSEPTHHSEPSHNGAAPAAAQPAML
jgi:hypothetical protein